MFAKSKNGSNSCQYLHIIPIFGLTHCQYLGFYQEYASNIVRIYGYTKSMHGTILKFKTRISIKHSQYLFYTKSMHQTISFYVYTKVIMERCQYYCLNQQYASNNISIYVYTKIMNKTLSLFMICRSLPLYQHSYSTVVNN